MLDFLRTQVDAYASIPVNLARLLGSLADAAEASVSLLNRLDERAEATNRVLGGFERPLVRLAEAVDGILIEQTVEALALLPNVLTQAAGLTDRTERMLSSLEGPLKTLGPLTQALDARRLIGLFDRLEESIPGLVGLPDTEREVRLLRETLDRMYRVIDEVQGRFGALPGAGLLLRRPGQGDPRPPIAAEPAVDEGRKTT